MNPRTEVLKLKDILLSTSPKKWTFELALLWIYENRTMITIVYYLGKQGKNEMDRKP